MPKSDDRFYLMEMRNRPALHGDIGSLLRIEGVVIGGGEARAIFLLPGTKIEGLTKNPRKVGIGSEIIEIRELSVEEWSDWLRRSDNPEILVGPTVDNTAPLPKIFHRKLRYEISGAVQQKVWAADHFACMYCGRKMGEVLLTIDHFQPLELGGKNDISNYLTACKPCNKDKGSQSPLDWLVGKRVRYVDVLKYLETRKV